MEAVLEKAYWEEMLSAEPSLWPLILNYNALKIPHLKIIDETLQNSEAEKSLTSWLGNLPNSLRLTPNSLDSSKLFWDFSNDTCKLALLDDLKLIDLSQVVGVTLEAQNLAKLVTRKDKLSLTEAIGDELYNYALVRGQYIGGEAAKIFSDLNQELPLATRCKLHGWLAFKMIAHNWPKDLALDFNSRLNNLANENLDAFTTAVSSQKSLILWRLIKKCLLREVAPSWKPYFKS